MTTSAGPVDDIAAYNDDRRDNYRHSRLIRLLDTTTDPTTLKAVLTYLQPWSTAFQRMISARVVGETDPELRAVALEHQREEIGHDKLLARSRGEDREQVWDPVIESGAAWMVDQLTHLPGTYRAVLAHLVLEAGSLTFSTAALRAFPDDEYFALHDEADVEHLQMGFDLLHGRDDWTPHAVIELLDRGWQVVTMVSDRIADLAAAPR